jgi:hypothetical protein
MIIKVLSVKQPLAAAIVQGDKDVENRTWRTRHRGRIYIHATLQPYNSAFEIGRIIKLDRSPAFGAIIGMVDLTDCLDYHESSWYIGGHCAWILENAVQFDEPIPCKGRLGLWTLKDKALIKAVLKQTESTNSAGSRAAC